MQNCDIKNKIKISDLGNNFSIDLKPEVFENIKNARLVMTNVSKYLANLNETFVKIKNLVKPRIIDAIINFQTNTRIINGHWVVINDELFDLLKTKKSIDEISKTIIDFYTEDKYKNLELLFEEIDDLDIIPERIPILKSCIKILKKNSQKNAYNVVLPTLMAQATGIIEEDCYNLLPEKLFPKDENKRKKVLNALEYFNCDILFYEMFDSAIIDGLFKKIKDNSEYESYKRECGSNRHKILHGEKEFLDYGTKENLIRTCLDLYMLCFAKMFLVNATSEIEEDYAK